MRWLFHNRLLVRRLRNAVAHGHMRFSSDSRLLEEVFVEVADFKPDTEEPYWIARIQGRELRSFCLKFIQLIEDRLG